MFRANQGYRKDMWMDYGRLNYMQIYIYVIGRATCIGLPTFSAGSVEFCESLLEGHVQGADLSFALRRPLQIVNRFSPSDPIGSGARVVLIVRIVYTLKFLQLLHYLHRLSV